MGRNSDSSSPSPTSASSPSGSAPLSTSRYSRSRSSHSDISLPASSSASTLLPTSVANRESSTAWLHLSPAMRSRIFHRLVHLPVSFCTSAHRIFCCIFHSGHTLKRWPLVRGALDHQQCAVGRTSAQCKYVRCGSFPLLGGRITNRASRYSQRPCRPACVFLTFCILSWRSDGLPIAALPLTFSQKSPA